MPRKPSALWSAPARCAASALGLAALLLAACGDSPSGQDGNKPGIVAALAVADRHACVLDADGNAWCWGQGQGGRVGTGDTLARAVPTRVVGGHRFVALAAGGGSTCGLTSSGEAWCWGLGDSHQLGTAAPEVCLVSGSVNGTAGCATSPVQVATSARFVELSVGAPFACGRTAAGEVWCWGRNDSLELGQALAQGTSGPVRVPSLPALAHISSGLVHACGLTATGAAWCWGNNTFAQIDSVAINTPVAPARALAAPAAYATLTAGATITCATTAAGQAFCWGMDYYGSLGSGTVASGTRQLTPSPVAGGIGFARVVPSRSNHVYGPACGLTASGAAYCWGANSRGQLGAPDVPLACPAIVTPYVNVGCSATPVPVQGPSLRAIAVGAEFACGVDNDGRIWCWGANEFGQLGNGGGGDSPVPVMVSGSLRAG